MKTWFDACVFMCVFVCLCLCVCVCVCVCVYVSALAHANVTDSVLEVVASEARRLFRDRLVSSKDLHAFNNILSSVIQGDWGSDALDNMSGTDFPQTHVISID